MRNRLSVACLAVLGGAALLTSACGSSRGVTITSEPSAAMVQVDGSNVGTTPFSHSFDFDRSSRYVVTAIKPGYFPEEKTITKKSEAVERKDLRFVLMEDEAWKVTTTSEATNAWLRVQVEGAIPAGDVWQKLVDSVTSRYSSLEQMDANSGYMRTVYYVRTFKNPHGDYKVRTRFLCSISSKSPLVYKMKIEAESLDYRGDWIPYGRVFKEDAQLVEEVQGRLGVK